MFFFLSGVGEKRPPRRVATADDVQHLQPHPPLAKARAFKLEAVAPTGISSIN